MNVLDIVFSLFYLSYITRNSFFHLERGFRFEWEENRKTL